MIFQHTWQKVLSGQKTQTRRLAGDSDRLWTVEQEDKQPEKVLITAVTNLAQPGLAGRGLTRCTR